MRWRKHSIRYIFLICSLPDRAIFRCRNFWRPINPHHSKHHPNIHQAACTCPRFERNAVKSSARIATAALLCAASPFATALSQPMGQTVEIVNQCPHDITIHAKGLFNPWRKVFNRRTLEAGGRMQETQFSARCFPAKSSRCPTGNSAAAGRTNCLTKRFRSATGRRPATRRCLSVRSKSSLHI